MIGNRGFLLDGTLSRGLKLLHDVLNIEVHVHLVLKMQE